MRILVIAGLLCIYSQLVCGQTMDPEFSPKPKVEIEKPYCEANVRELDNLEKKVGSTDLLIIVSHVGLGERKSWGPRRLYNAKSFFNRSPTSRPGNSIVTAEGERVSGYGYIDFYLKGQLELRIHVNNNRDLIVTACIVDPPNSRCSSTHERLFYPCKSKR